MTKHVSKAMILAAGIGTRLEPLTFAQPKPMMPIANVPIMEHIINNLLQHGVTDIVSNTFHLSSNITNYFNEIRSDATLQFLKEDKLSGTAGCVKICERFLNNGKPFIVTSGDALTDINFSKLIKQHVESGAFATIALKEIPKESVEHFGVLVLDENNRVLEIQEKPKVEEAKSNLVNTCIYIFEPGIFDYIPQNTFYDFAKQVIPKIISDGKLVSGFRVDDYWSDIGTLKQYLESSVDVLRDKIHIERPKTKYKNGWVGLNTKIGSNVIFEDAFIIGDNCIIEDNVIMQNNVSIGSNCKISNNVKLDRSLIWNNVIIGSNVNILDCIISDNVEIESDVSLNGLAITASGIKSIQ